MQHNPQHILETAQTIRCQLTALTPVNTLMSWGISRLSASHIDNMPALKLIVNGRLHKGAVIIAHNEGADYYEIYLDSNGVTRKIACDVDFTQLGDIIDTAIEKGEDPEEYNRFCREQRDRLFRGDI